MADLMKLTAGICLGLGLSSAAFADALTLRLGHNFQSTHFIHTKMATVFAEGVKARTKGEVSFEFYPAGQLGKDTPSLMESGLLDMGIIATGNFPDKFPLTAVGELPGLATDACDGAARMQPLAAPGGLLAQSEWDQMQLRVLASNMMSPYTVFTRNAGLNRLEDMAGRKLRVSGPGTDQLVRELGGVPINIPSGEIYDAVSRGTVDGVILSPASVLIYDLDASLDHAIGNLGFGAPFIFLSITETAWGDLSPELQQILGDEAAKVQASYCTFANESDQLDRAALTEGGKFTFTTLTEVELQRAAQTLTAFGDTWAAEMDRLRLPGTAVLAAFRAGPAAPN